MTKKRKSLISWVLPEWKEDFHRDNTGWRDEDIMFPNWYKRNKDFVKVRITIEEI